jgi:hypothetical protein
MKILYKPELFATGLGGLAGLATAGYDIIILSNSSIPMAQLNLDIIYPIFFLLMYYAYLFSAKAFHIRNIALGTTFFMIASVLFFAALLYLVPSNVFLPRFLSAYPGVSLGAGFTSISLGRLTWCFILMLVGIALSSVLNRKTILSK